jgi:hypothetical protein
MTREEGLREIDGAPWANGDGCLEMRVHDANGHEILAWLAMRQPYCDRGHIQLNIDGPLGLDDADRFPRYFFSFAEADAHTRDFLKWRLWRERGESVAALRSVFEG